MSRRNKNNKSTKEGRSEGETHTNTTDQNINNFLLGCTSDGNTNGQDNSREKEKQYTRYGLRERNETKNGLYKLDDIFKDDDAETIKKHSHKSNKRSRNGKSKCGRKRKYFGETAIRQGATRRERNRFQSLNSAFESLRNVIPKGQHFSHQKLSKAATLRLAAKYISLLTDALNSHDLNTSTSSSDSLCGLVEDHEISSPPCSPNSTGTSASSEKENAEDLKHLLIENIDTDAIFRELAEQSFDLLRLELENNGDEYLGTSLSSPETYLDDPNCK